MEKKRFIIAQNDYNNKFTVGLQSSKGMIGDFDPSVTCLIADDYGQAESIKRALYQALQAGREELTAELQTFLKLD